MKQQISELFIKHSVHTNQALINDLVSLVEARDKEIAQMIEGMRKTYLDKQENEITPEPTSCLGYYNRGISDVITKLEQQK